MTSVMALGRASMISGVFASGTGSYGRNLQTPESGVRLRRSTSMNSGACDKQGRSASKGFYRQPNIQRVRPAPSPNCEVRRKQFAQKLMWYSDASDGLLDPHQADIGLTYHDRRHSSAEVYSHKYSSPSSILKRTESEMEAVHLTPAAFNPDRRPSTCSVRKSTSFRENVDVIYYDQRERTTCGASREQEKLKDEKKENHVTERSSRVKCNLHPEGECNREKLEDSEHDADANVALKPSFFDGKEVNIIKDEVCGFKLKLSVPIGPDFIRNRTSMKALSGGKKLILIAYKLEKQVESMASVHQYIERLSLPHAIDAYGVKATMDKDGNLKITAPLRNADSLLSADTRSERPSSSS